MLFSKNETAVPTRVAVLETLFIEFQDRIKEHMETEEMARMDIKNSLKEVIQHIDSTQKNNEIALSNMKDSVLESIKNEYSSQIATQTALTNMRASILLDIQAEKKRSVREFRILVGGFLACLALCAWLYVNVVQKEANTRYPYERTTIESKVAR